jgi:hypothetical protein
MKRSHKLEIRYESLTLFALLINIPSFSRSDKRQEQRSRRSAIPSEQSQLKVIKLRTNAVIVDIPKSSARLGRNEAEKMRAPVRADEDVPQYCDAIG